MQRYEKKTITYQKVGKRLKVHFFVPKESRFFCRLMEKS